MKNIAAIFLAVSVIFPLAGCAKNNESPTVSADISGGEAANLGAVKEPIVKHDNPRVDYTRDYKGRGAGDNRAQLKPESKRRLFLRFRTENH